MNSTPEEIIKGLIKETLVKAAVRKLVAAVPFLGIPVLGPLVAYLVGKLFEVIYDEVALVMRLTAVDIQVTRERTAYEAAVAELKKKMEGENDEEIRKAEEEFRRRLGDLIRFPVP